MVGVPHDDAAGARRGLRRRARRPRRSSRARPRGRTCAERIADYAIPERFERGRRAAAQRQRQDRPAANPGGRRRFRRRGRAMKVVRCTRSASRQELPRRSRASSSRATSRRRRARSPTRSTSSAASIYYHYPDKQQILFELIDSTMDAARRRRPSGCRPRARPADGSSPRSSSTTSRCTRLRPRETTLGETELRSLTGERRDEVRRLARRVRERSSCGVLDRRRRRRAVPRRSTSS